MNFYSVPIFSYYIIIIKVDIIYLKLMNLAFILWSTIISKK